MLIFLSLCRRAKKKPGRYYPVPAPYLLILNKIEMPGRPVKINFTAFLHYRYTKDAFSL